MGSGETVKAVKRKEKTQRMSHTQNAQGLLRVQEIVFSWCLRGCGSGGEHNEPFSPFLFLPSSFAAFCGAITFCRELRLELGFPDPLLRMEPFWLGERLQVTIATRQDVSSPFSTSFQGYFIRAVCITEFSALIWYRKETEQKQHAATR